MSFCTSQKFDNCLFIQWQKNKQKYFIALSFKFGAKINSLKWKQNHNEAHTESYEYYNISGISQKQWKRKIFSKTFCDSFDI